jgi:hypothetical protein
MKFPHVVAGAYGSSAYVKAEAGFNLINTNLKDVLERIEEGCAAKLQKYFLYVDKTFEFNTEEKNELKHSFKANMMRDDDFLAFISMIPIDIIQSGDPDVMCWTLSDSEGDFAAITEYFVRTPLEWEDYDSHFLTH